MVYKGCIRDEIDERLYINVVIMIFSLIGVRKDYEKLLDTL